MPDQLVNLDMKHGVEAKNYEEVWIRKLSLNTRLFRNSPGIYYNLKVLIQDHQTDFSQYQYWDFCLFIEDKWKSTKKQISTKKKKKKLVPSNELIHSKSFIHVNSS